MSDENNLMYVYYTSNRRLIGVSKELVDDFKNCAHCKMPLSEVARFISGKESTKNYIVTTDQSGKSYLEKAQPEEVTVSAFDEYMVEIEEGDEGDHQFSIVNNLVDNTVTVSLEKTFKEAIMEFIGDDYSFNGVTTIPLYFTLEDNSAILVETINISVESLFKSDSIVIPCKEDLSETSLFYKKLFTSHKYEVIRE